jgi:hypothetical protein
LFGCGFGVWVYLLFGFGLLLLWLLGAVAAQAQGTGHGLAVCGLLRFAARIIQWPVVAIAITQWLGLGPGAPASPESHVTYAYA